MNGRPIIFSASIGHGHNQAAKAIQQEFQEQGYQPRIIDTFYALHPVLHFFIVKSYIHMLKLTPSLWGWLYFRAEKQPLFLLLDRFSTLFVDQLYTMMTSEDCPFIISTHPFVTAFLTRVKQVKKLNMPLYTVITDFVLHPAYLREEVDGYFTADNEIESFAYQHNMNMDRFFSTGIPICNDPCFEKSKTLIRKELGLNSNQKILLIAGGGIGLTDYLKVIQSLECLKEPIQIICMVGHNRTVGRKVLKHDSKHSIKVVGFSHLFLHYIKACDVIVSKAGGLTLAEALACETPIVIFNPLPGQEEHNAHYLSRLGAVKKVNCRYQLSNVVQELLYEESENERLRSYIKKIKRPNAANKVVEKILMLSSEAGLR